MRNTMSRDTPCEIAIRRILFARGYRYRVDARPLKQLRRKADLVFPGRRVAVFVDGCFWHSCPIHGTQAKSNAEWWREKLAGNVRRDGDTDAQLRANGWTVVRVWEHEPAEPAADRIEHVLVERQLEDK